VERGLFIAGPLLCRHARCSDSLHAGLGLRGFVPQFCVYICERWAGSAAGCTSRGWCSLLSVQGCVQRWRLVSLHGMLADGHLDSALGVVLYLWTVTPRVPPSQVQAQSQTLCLQYKNDWARWCPPPDSSACAGLTHSLLEPASSFKLHRADSASKPGHSQPTSYHSYHFPAGAASGAGCPPPLMLSEHTCVQRCKAT
jgi:hypothetical protein